jgi:hypothetical protein
LVPLFPETPIPIVSTRIEKILDELRVAAPKDPQINISAAVD